MSIKSAQDLLNIERRLDELDRFEFGVLENMEMRDLFGVFHVRIGNTEVRLTAAITEAARQSAASEITELHNGRRALLADFHREAMAETVS